MLFSGILAGLGSARKAGQVLKTNLGSYDKQVSSDPAYSDDLDYNALYAANPYRNYTYKRSWFQNLLGALGLRSDADRYEEEMAMNAREYDANIALKEYNENFEDPVNEAQRLRAAGINPALSGLGDANGASPISPDENPPSAMGSDVDTIQGFASSVMNLYQLTMGFAGDLESLKSLKLANESGDIDNIGKMLGLANDLVFQSTGGKFDPSDSGALDQLMGTYEYMSGVSGLFSKRSQKRFKTASATAINNLPNMLKIYESRNKLGNERLAYGQLRGSQYYSDEDEFLWALTEPLSSLNDSILKSGKEREIAENAAGVAESAARVSEAEVTQEYNEAFSPETAASAVNAQNRETAASSSYMTELQSAFRSIISNLHSLAEKGNKLAPIGLLLAQLIQSQFFANAARDAIRPAPTSSPAPRVNVYTR